MSIGIAELINSLRESFLVHSYLYYRLGTPTIPDSLFDARARHLAELQRKHPDIAAKCIFADYFARFDPSTGMEVPDDEWIRDRANQRLKSWRD